MNDTKIHSLGFGLATRNAKNEVIEVYYPQPVVSPDAALSSLLLASYAIQTGENSVTQIDEKLAPALASQLLEADFPSHAEQVQQMNDWYELWSKGGAAPNFRIENPEEYIKNFNWVNNWINNYFLNKVSDFIFGLILLVGIVSLFFREAFFSKKKSKFIKIYFHSKS